MSLTKDKLHFVIVSGCIGLIQKHCHSWLREWTDVPLWTLLSLSLSLSLTHWHSLSPLSLSSWQTHYDLCATFNSLPAVIRQRINCHFINSVRECNCCCRGCCCKSCSCCRGCCCQSYWCWICCWGCFSVVFTFIISCLTWNWSCRIQSYRIIICCPKSIPISRNINGGGTQRVVVNLLAQCLFPGLLDRIIIDLADTNLKIIKEIQLLWN